MSSLRGLLLPLACAGCGRWDYNLCPSCAMLLAADPELRTVDDGAGDPVLPVYSLGSYGGALRRLIISAKHQPGRYLGDDLFQAGAHLAQAVAPLLQEAQSIWVVPAPPSLRRAWDRGQITQPIGEGVRVGLIELLPGAAVQLTLALRLRVGWSSQSAKSKDARRRGRHGAFAPSAKPPAHTAIVLVDDVVTTGATMLEMLRVLGEQVQMGVVLAAA